MPQVWHCSEYVFPTECRVSATKIINGRILTPEGWQNSGCVVFSNGQIVGVEPYNAEIADATVIDARGKCVVPGFIDTHVHGGGGHDFREATPEAFNAIAKAHASHGTTAMYATLAAASRQNIDRAIRCCERFDVHTELGASILGLHLEGNYLNPTMSGAQPSQYITLPDAEEYRSLLESTRCIKRWSAAPELPGALEFARYATSHGVVVSAAHTAANYAQMLEAFDAGFTHATHFYNAMTSVHKQREFKHEGTVEAVYLIDGMTVEVIADGIHVPSAILRLVHKIKGTERTALVTDSMAAGACEDPPSLFDSAEIIEDGVCKLADRSALAGSIATTDRLVRTMVSQAGVTLAEAVTMATLTPARIMGIDNRKGSIQSGKDADIVIMDSQAHIDTVIVHGRTVFSEQ